MSPLDRRLAALVTVTLAVALAAGPASRADDDTCLACHGDPSMFEGADAARLVVDGEVLAASIHGSAGLTCVDCHTDLAGDADLPHASELAPVACGTCHGDVEEVYGSSYHGYALSRGSRGAPTCASCHGAHDILPASSPDAPTHATRRSEACASCHGATGLVTDGIVKLPRALPSYEQSVHAGGAATCADCHGVHDLRGPADPRSPIHRSRISSTCGTCHADVRAVYESSIHGRALEAGVWDSPTCTDCHGEHRILSKDDPRSPTSPTRMARDTCGSCHDDQDMVAKYGLRGGVVGSYVDSYHGWATRRESRAAASCAGCHTAHGVLPASHPDSTVHADRVVETCRTCHPRADARFAASYTHDAVSIAANPINRGIRLFYLVLIAVVVGGMVVHNLVILNFHMVERRRAQRAGRTLRRFDRVQIVQHLALIVSFTMLVLTGFALRFPDAGWVRLLGAVGLTEELRGDLHRLFGLVLIGVGLSHVVYVLASRRGREEFREICPRRFDLREMRDHLRYHTWRSRRPAEFGRYDYTQKAEYWALVWGTVLMVLTGFVLWLPELAVRIFPAWIVAASQTVHYYEAWLATLAIVFWHFFFVIFHPGEYPMSWTWLTGRVSAESVRRHHPRWYREEITSVRRVSTSSADETATKAV